MNWQDTVIKSKQIKWVRPRIKNIEDGKLDIILNIPLTQLIESQARLSFSSGVLATLKFYLDYQANKRTVGRQDMEGFLNACGLPELAKKFEGETIK